MGALKKNLIRAAAVCEGITPMAPFLGSLSPSGPADGENWRTGESVTFSCLEGMTRVGVASRACTNTSSWEASWDSESDPVCEDPNAPKISCPSVVALATDARKDRRVIVKIEEELGVTYSDDVMMAYTPLTSSPTFPGPLQFGTHTVVVTAWDASGNSDSCTITVHIVDREPPTVLCPNNVYNYQVFRNPTVIQFPSSAIVFDNIDREEDIAVSMSISSGTFLPPGPHTITVTATDKSGNTDSCNFLAEIVGCSTHSERAAEDERCKCMPGYWQDLDVSRPASRVADGRNSDVVVCRACVQDSMSEKDSTHPSACVCNEGFYFVPDISKGDDERDEFFWTSGRCQPCVKFADCSGGVVGSPTANSTTMNSSASTARLRLLSTAGNASITNTEEHQARRFLRTTDSAVLRFYNKTQHARPVPKEGYALVQAYPFAQVVPCQTASNCKRGGQEEYQSEEGYAACTGGSRGPTCNECEAGLKRNTDGGELTGKCGACPPFLTNLLGQLALFLFMQATVVFYTIMNIAPSEDDERTFVVAIRTLLNYLSLMGIIGVFDTYKINFPDWVHARTLFPYPNFPSLVDLVSLDCVIEPFLRMSGIEDDNEVLVLIRLINASMILASFIFLTVFLSLVVLIAACVERKRVLKKMSAEEDRHVVYFKQYWASKSGRAGRGSEWDRQQVPEERLGEPTDAEKKQLEKQLKKDEASKRLLGLFRYHIPIATTDGERFSGQLAKVLFTDIVPVWIVLYFLTFEGTVDELVSLIRCAPLADGLEKRLADIPSISCQSEVYSKWMPVAFGGVVILAIVIPFCLAFLVIRGSRVLKGLKARENEDAFRRTFGFLIQGYDFRYVYWELVIIGRKFAVLLLIAYYPGEDPDMRLIQVSMFAVFVLVLQLRIQPFSRQDRGILNDLELHALAVWLLTLVAFSVRRSEGWSIMYIKPIPENSTFIVALGALILNASFMIRAAWIIGRGYVLAFYDVIEEFKEAEEPEKVIPEIWIRVPVRLALPVIETLLIRPVKALAVFFPVPHIALDSRNAASAFAVELRSAVDGSVCRMTADVLESTMAVFNDATRQVFDEWEEWMHRDKGGECDLGSTERELMKSLQRFRTGQLESIFGDGKEDKAGLTRDRKKVCTAIYFQEFILRWALVTAEAFEDEKMKEAAEQSNDLDLLFYVAQKMLRPMRYQTHPFEALLKEMEKKDQKEKSLATSQKDGGEEEEEEEDTDSNFGSAAEKGAGDAVSSTNKKKEKVKKIREWTRADVCKLRRPAIPLPNVRWKPLQRIQPPQVFQQTQRMSVQIDRRMSKQHSDHFNGDRRRSSFALPMSGRRGSTQHNDRTSIGGVKEKDVAAAAAGANEEFAAYVSATARLSVSRQDPGDGFSSNLFRSASLEALQEKAKEEGGEEEKKKGKGRGPVPLVETFQFPSPRDDAHPWDSHYDLEPPSPLPADVENLTANASLHLNQQEGPDALTLLEEEPTQMQPQSPHPETPVPLQALPSTPKKSILRTGTSALNESGVHESPSAETGMSHGQMQRQKFRSKLSRRLSFADEMDMPLEESDGDKLGGHSSRPSSAASTGKEGNRGVKVSREEEERTRGRGQNLPLPIGSVLSPSNRHLSQSSPSPHAWEHSPAASASSSTRRRSILVRGGTEEEFRSPSTPMKRRSLSFAELDSDKEGEKEDGEGSGRSASFTGRRAKESGSPTPSLLSALKRRFSFSRRQSQSQTSLGEKRPSTSNLHEEAEGDNTGRSFRSDSVIDGDGSRRSFAVFRRRSSGHLMRGVSGQSIQSSPSVEHVSALPTGKRKWSVFRRQSEAPEPKKSGSGTAVAAAAAARLFGGPLPLLAERSRFPFSLTILKKVGDAFFEGDMNDEALKEGLTADALSKAVRRFLRMHPAVGIWHYFAFLSAKRDVEVDMYMVPFIKYVCRSGADIGPDSFGQDLNRGGRGSALDFVVGGAHGADKFRMRRSSVCPPPPPLSPLSMGGLSPATPAGIEASLNASAFHPFKSLCPPVGSFQNSPEEGGGKLTGTELIDFEGKEREARYVHVGLGPLGGREFFRVRVPLMDPYGNAVTDLRENPFMTVETPPKDLRGEAKENWMPRVQVWLEAGCGGEIVPRDEEDRSNEDEAVDQSSEESIEIDQTKVTTATATGGGGGHHRGSALTFFPSSEDPRQASEGEEWMGSDAQSTEGNAVVYSNVIRIQQPEPEPELPAASSRLSVDSHRLTQTRKQSLGEPALLVRNQEDKENTREGLQQSVSQGAGSRRPTGTGKPLKLPDPIVQSLQEIVAVMKEAEEESESASDVEEGEGESPAQSPGERGNEDDFLSIEGEGEGDGGNPRGSVLPPLLSSSPGQPSVSARRGSVLPPLPHLSSPSLSVSPPPPSVNETEKGKETDSIRRGSVLPPLLSTEPVGADRRGSVVPPVVPLQFPSSPSERGTSPLAASPVSVNGRPEERQQGEKAVKVQEEDQERLRRNSERPPRPTEVRVLIPPSPSPLSQRRSPPPSSSSSSSSSSREEDGESSSLPSSPAADSEGEDIEKGGGGGTLQRPDGSSAGSGRQNLSPLPTAQRSPCAAGESALGLFKSLGLGEVWKKETLLPSRRSSEQVMSQATSPREEKGGTGDGKR
uniref:HYR domain-containing protein n=1 Tax=Chromera velia CCMP2878 TaxID=1169474 RepID=A0A0G4HT29_9ALVE|eukprot:Cvel_8394.t1-p1 / transcript=Cvel_8394.t1 / gene=Cvel_8394 / organism=Chromera_velia_CCMP2878 / gene_product=Sushi, von Willebrand factor type A, EGF and, putative / transcript_product=Sushi, von Willebrand factor type A, EGF and, putative / location=Cvel_scaffold463:25142-36284(-) / protein_length=2611 / sequence_SO=supercontig / SO=protein_coding / is_pseudo=false